MLRRDEEIEKSILVHVQVNDHIIIMYLPKANFTCPKEYVFFYLTVQKQCVNVFSKRNKIKNRYELYCN